MIRLLLLLSVLITWFPSSKLLCHPRWLPELQPCAHAPANRKKKVEGQKGEILCCQNHICNFLSIPHLPLLTFHWSYLDHPTQKAGKRQPLIGCNMAPNNIMCLPPREKRRMLVESSSLDSSWPIIMSSRGPEAPAQIPWNLK